MSTDMERTKMATTKSTSIEITTRPLIQIDDLIREMTDEEYAVYQEQVINAPVTPLGE